MNAIDKPVAAKSTAVEPITASIYPVTILAALNAVMAKVGYVQKQGKNEFHKYRYAGEGHLLEVLRPAMVEAGLLLIPSTKSFAPPDEFGNTIVGVEYTLAHKDGDVWPEKILALGAGNDKNSKGGVGDKGLYKALTGANKYLLFKLFQIETGDDPEQISEHDKDGAPVRPNGTPEPDQVKNPPGRSGVVTQVRALVRDVMSCGDSDSLIALINGDEFKKIGFKACREYPRDWRGEEERSGLAGCLESHAKTLGCEYDARIWIEKMEKAAAVVVSKQAAE